MFLETSGTLAFTCWLVTFLKSLSQPLLSGLAQTGLCPQVSPVLLNAIQRLFGLSPSPRPSACHSSPFSSPLLWAVNSALLIHACLRYLLSPTPWAPWGGNPACSLQGLLSSLVPSWDSSRLCSFAELNICAPSECWLWKTEPGLMVPKQLGEARDLDTRHGPKTGASYIIRERSRGRSVAHTGSSMIRLRKNRCPES